MPLVGEPLLSSREHRTQRRLGGLIATVSVLLFVSGLIGFGLPGVLRVVLMLMGALVFVAPSELFERYGSYEQRWHLANPGPELLSGKLLPARPLFVQEREQLAAAAQQAPEPRRHRFLDQVSKAKVFAQSRPQGKSIGLSVRPRAIDPDAPELEIVEARQPKQNLVDLRLYVLYGQLWRLDVGPENLTEPAHGAELPQGDTAS